MTEKDKVKEDIANELKETVDDVGELVTKLIVRVSAIFNKYTQTFLEKGKDKMKEKIDEKVVNDESTERGSEERDKTNCS